jgi:site-specific recombinase XerD
MQIYPRGNILWCRFKHRGERHDYSTDVRRTDKGAERKARQAAEVLRARVIVEEGPGGRAGVARVSLADIEELHVEYLENKGYGPRRIETVENLHSHLQRHLGGEHRDVMTLTVAEVEAYEGKRRRDKKPARGQTIRRERGALKRAMRLAKKQGLVAVMPIDWDDVERIKSDPKKKSQTAKLHSREVVELVLSKLSAKAKTAGHEHICRFVMMTGLRAEELPRAPGYEIIPALKGVKAAAVMVVPMGEGKTPGLVPLKREALKILQEWGHRFPVADVAHALNRASKAAGVVPGVTLRDLRKFCGSHVARRDLTAAQKILRHEKISTTALYVEADVSDTAEAMGTVTRLARGNSRGNSRKQAVKKRSDYKGARSSGG